MGDDNFYSTFGKDSNSESDVSEANMDDVNKMLIGLDDLDNDLLGSLGKSKKKPAAKSDLVTAGKPPRTPTKSLKKSSTDSKLPVSSYDLDDILAKPNPLDDIATIVGLSDRPSSAPTSSPKKTLDRPSSAPTMPSPKAVLTKPKPVKRDFGAFDEDDPLAGLLSDDDEPVSKKGQSTKPAPTPASVGIQETAPASAASDRPATSSGSNASVKEEQMPVKTRTAGGRSVSSRNSSITSGRDTEPSSFNDDDINDDDLFGDLGLGDSAPAKGAESTKPASSIMDTLLGKSTPKKSESPAKKEFNWDKQFSKPGTGDADSKASGKGASGDIDAMFGDYMPSATSSRPSSRRSVRFFEEDDPVASSKEKTESAGRPLGLSSTLGNEQAAKKNQPKQRPLGMASTGEISSRSSKDADDWLGMSDSQDQAAFKADPALTQSIDSKRPNSKGDGEAADDWLSLGASYNSSSSKFNQEDDWLGTGSKQSAKTNEVNDKQNIQSSSRGKQEQGDDWLGLGSAEPKESAGGHTPLSISKTTSKTQSNESKAAAGRGNRNTPAKSNKRDFSKLLGDSYDKDLGQTFTLKEADTLKRTSDKSVVDSSSGLPELPNRLEKSIPSSAGDALEFSLDATPSRRNVDKGLPRQRPPDSPNLSGVPKEPQFDMKATYSLPVLDDSRDQLLDQQKMFERNLQLEKEKQNLEIQHLQRMKLEQQKAEQQKMLFEQQRAHEEQMRRLRDQMQLSSPSRLASDQMGLMHQDIANQSVLQDLNLNGQVKRLEMERDHLQGMIECLKKSHQDEIEALQKSHQSRMEITEETYQRRESRLKQENDVLVKQNMERLQYIEEEKAKLSASYYRQLEEMERDKHGEVGKIREKHRTDLDLLRTEYEMAVERFKKTKEQEVDALANSHLHTGTFQTLVDKMKQNMEGLDNLHQRVESKHSNVLTEREIAAKTIQEQLKVLQTRLLMQQSDNDKERSTLQELIAKMEVQLSEQTQQMQQQQWDLTQEKTKVKALQAALEEEKKILSTRIAQERSLMQRSRDALLGEQASMLSQLCEERKGLAEERSQFTVSQRMLLERENTETLKRSQNKADYEGLLTSAKAERDAALVRTQEVRQMESRVAQAQAQAQEARAAVEQEKARLEIMALQLKKKSEEIEGTVLAGVKAKEEGALALMESKKLAAKHNQRLSDIQAHLDVLGKKQKQMAEEKLILAKERKKLDKCRASILCVSCQTPVRDIPTGDGLSLSSIRSDPSGFGPQVLKMQIRADREDSYLKDESRYLETLKYSPYHGLKHS